MRGSESEAKTTVKRGREAEMLAVSFLESQDYQIVRRNYRVAGGEVDIIAWDGAVLCFIEVRSRASSEFGDPLETINSLKISRIVRATRRYLEDELSENEAPWPVMRFDAVGIVLENDAPPAITLVRDAFCVDR